MADSKASARCFECRRVIELGRDVLAVEQGVMGPRGFVLLGEIMLLCSDNCAEAHFAVAAELSPKELHRLRRRIP